MSGSERHDRVTELFLGACRLAPDRRSVFLDEHCANDAALRSEVEEMLAADEAGHAVLDGPSPGAGFRISWRPLAPPGPGDQIAPTRGGAVPPGYRPRTVGDYTVIEVLGEGGMGIVYLAEQKSPRRRVALKLLRPVSTSADALRRFEHESEVLALLHHPGIAQIHQAGLADGGAGPQPFFAMEYVDGLPVTEYVQRHATSTRGRLELICAICDAVHHAHQKGVVHRDLKPGNILVDASGQTKVLDFGVARTSNADLQVTTVQTGAGELLGTVPYMSPEQAAGDPAAIDIRSDVYAIGVVAYELLAGRLPYDLEHKVVHEALRVIERVEPRPLSSTDSVFRGDLDTILAKALEKDPARRYQSASDLAADVRRHLNHEPITARPASAAYQLRKFARRHRAAAALAVAVVAALFLGTLATSWQALRATRAETRAAGLASSEARQRAVAEAINEFLIDDLLAAAAPSVEPGKGRNVSMREVLDEAARRIDEAAGPGGRFEDEPLVEASIRATIGRTYERLGEITAAQAHIERSVELRRRELGDKHPETLRALGDLGSLHQAAGRYEEAEALLTSVVDALTDALGEDDQITLTAMNSLANTFRFAGRLDEAEPLYVRALQGLTQTLGEDDRSTLIAALNLGRLYEEQGRYEDAERLLVHVVDRWRDTLGDDDPLTLSAMDDLAGLYRQQGRNDEAIPFAEQALEGQERVLGEDHPETLGTMDTLAGLYLVLGRLEDAEALRQRSLDGHRRVVGDEHPNTLVAMHNLAAVLFRQRRYGEAEALMLQVLQIRERVLGEDHPGTLKSITGLSAVYLSQERYQDAMPLLVRTVELQRRTIGSKHPNTLFSMLNLAQAYREMDRLEDARALQEEAVASARTVWPEGSWFVGGFLRDLGKTLLRMERFADAERALLEAHEILDGGLGPGHARTQDAIDSLVALYEAWDKPKQAAAWRAKLPLGTGSDDDAEATEPRQRLMRA